MPAARSLTALVVQHDEDKPLDLLVGPLEAAGVELEVRFAGRDGLALDGYAAVVALPGFANPVDDTDAVNATRDLLRESLSAGLPALGICLGAQLLAQAAGAQAYACTEEYGYAAVEIDPRAHGDALLGGLPGSIDVFHAHGYAVELPPGGVGLARTANALQAYRLGATAWGLQFHPEPSVELVDTWIRLHADRMRAKGLDPIALAADARRLEPGIRELAITIATRFAAIVHGHERA